MATPDLDILGSLTRFLRERGAPQLFAWDRSLSSLKEAFGECLSQAKDCELVLEYELPRVGTLPVQGRQGKVRGASAGGAGGGLSCCKKCNNCRGWENLSSRKLQPGYQL